MRTGLPMGIMDLLCHFIRLIKEDWNRMYKVLKIVEGDATRQVELKDLGTGAIELCFDDSALVSDRNFDFMQVGQQYDCRIKLFGKPVPKKTDTSITCKIMRTEVMVGERVFTEVMTSCGVYYVPSKKIAEYLTYGYFEFICTRKDLVQVNGTVHGDLCSD